MDRGDKKKPGDDKKKPDKKKPGDEKKKPDGKKSEGKEKKTFFSRLSRKDIFNKAKESKSQAAGTSSDSVPGGSGVTKDAQQGQIFTDDRTDAGAGSKVPISEKRRESSLQRSPNKLVLLKKFRSPSCLNFGCSKTSSKDCSPIKKNKSEKLGSNYAQSMYNFEKLNPEAEIQSRPRQPPPVYDPGPYEIVPGEVKAIEEMKQRELRSASLGENIPLRKGSKDFISTFHDPLKRSSEPEIPLFYVPQRKSRPPSPCPPSINPEMYTDDSGKEALETKTESSGLGKRLLHCIRSKPDRSLRSSPTESPSISVSSISAQEVAKDTSCVPSGSVSPSKQIHKNRSQSLTLDVPVDECANKFGRLSPSPSKSRSQSPNLSVVAIAPLRNRSRSPLNRDNKEQAAAERDDIKVRMKKRQAEQQYRSSSEPHQRQNPEIMDTERPSTSAGSTSVGSQSAKGSLVVDLAKTLLIYKRKKSESPPK